MAPLKSLRPFGLRWRRLLEWARVLREAGRTLTLRDLLAMVRLALIGQPSPSAAADYRVCVRCPFHDLTLRQCLGCGCYMPYKLATGGTCWAREQDPASRIGFPKNQPMDF